jgi:diguanylate cyclase (GGDEF)-like protein
MDLRRTVLIVEDDKINCKILSNIINKNYIVFVANNGVEALEQLNRHYEQISIIILDIVMPLMDGFEFLEIKNKDERYRFIPTIVLTSKSSTANELKALKLGASEFVSKPYVASLIVQRIKNLIELKETSMSLNQLQKDFLTGVYNKETFSEKASYRIKESDSNFNFIVIGISNYKLISDLFGIYICDKAIKQLAVILKEYTSNRDGLVGRHRGSTFIVMLNGGNDTIIDFMEYVNERNTNIIKNFDVDIKFGIYQSAYDNIKDIDTICNCASVSYNSLKSDCFESYKFFDSKIIENARAENEINNDVIDSIQKGDIYSVFQPKYSLTTKKIIGFEALSRWNHPTKGLLLPDYYISILEKNNKIFMMDVVIWESACKRIVRNRELYNLEVPISINVSKIDILNKYFIETLLAFCQKYNVKKELLHLEITESVYMSNKDFLGDMLNQLKCQGFIIEMDDFGKGYSSLASLYSLPFDIIKLDMGFLKTNRSKSVVKFIIEMAENLNMGLIAEGITNKETEDYLNENGCKIGQGYYFSKPLDSDELDRLLSSKELKDE